MPSGDKPKDHDAHWRPTPKYPRFEKDDRDERHGGMGATSGTTGMATGTTTGMMTGTMTGMMTGTMTGTARGPTTGMTGTTTMQGTHPAQTTGMVMMRDTGHTLATRRMSCTFTQSQDMHTTTQTTHNTMVCIAPNASVWSETSRGHGWRVVAQSAAVGHTHVSTHYWIIGKRE